MSSTPWRDWPASERDAALPINATFLANWNERNRSLRSRPGVGWDLDASFSGTVDTWTAVATGGELWVPPWAVELVAQVWMTIEGVGDVEGPGEGRARLLIGSTYSTEARVFLSCVVGRSLGGPFDDPPGEPGPPFCRFPSPGADGEPDFDWGTYYRKELIWAVPAAARGTVQAVSLELRRSVNATAVRYKTVRPTGAPNRRTWHWRG